MRRRTIQRAMVAGFVTSMSGLGLLCGCVAEPDPGVEGRVSLDDVRFWAYQINGLDSDGAVDALVASRYDLLVLEPTRTDRSSTEFDAAVMVKRLHASPASIGERTKLVVAYIDIGEAEDWRYYWTEDWVAPTDTERGTPDFMIHPDPDGWAGNFPVAFWDQRWKDIMIYNDDSMLQQALDDGFDGIYMDWVEAYSDTAIIEAAELAGVDPIAEMVNFIREIRDFARRQKPGFLIIPQNASELAETANGYLDLIDAIGQEQIYFDGDADTIWSDANSGDVRLPATGDGFSTEFYERTLEPFIAAGKVVLCVDYAQQPDNVAEAYERAVGNGYIPYVALRSLSQLTETPPPGYAE
jgi:cysteinyl-tRNA synthetase, unknown class